MRWITAIQKAFPDAQFSPAADQRDISACESALAISLPSDLSKLLFESNGVLGEYSLGLVWPVERIQADNLEFRSHRDFRDLYMPFDNLLFFGDAGNGDQFAYPIHGNSITRDDIFVWNHEDDSRTWVAPSLEKYFIWWSDGTLKV